MSKGLDPLKINKNFLEKLKGLSKDHPLYQEYLRIKARVEKTRKEGIKV